jgi:hypothetical protein
MKGKIAALLAAMLSLSLVAGPASADEHGEPWPEHGHMLLLHADYSGEGETTFIHSYRTCIDIASGRKLDRAHHTTIHQGRAGAVLRGAGHLVVPTAGMTPWANCQEAVEMGFLPS